MEPKDIDLFIRAKKKTIIPNILTGISLLLFCSIFVLEFIGIEHIYTLTILVWVTIFYSFAFGVGKWAFVPREELIGIIERQINSNAEALDYLSNKST